jgi:polyisoprenoid-binding protein YceI
MPKENRPFLLAVLVALFAAPSLARGIPWQIDPAHSTAQFAVHHLMISNVKGEFSKVTGLANLDENDLTRSTVEVNVDAATVNTREPQRDAHLRSADFFDVARYPTITFRSRRITPTGNGKFKMTGDLTIHGVTREVTFDVEGPTPAIKDPQGNVRVGASAIARINRKDFGLLWNAALEGGGVVVGDEVAIAIEVELVKQAPAALRGSGN